METLHQKSRAFDLYACQKSGCNVMTFIKQINCPSCGTVGAILRFSDTFEKGQPPDPRGRPIAGERETG